LTDDNFLASGIRSDNLAAFELLYHRYKKKLYYFSLRYLKDEAEAEEIVQIVFINVWEKRNYLDPTNSVKSYIYKAAANYIYNYLKKKSIHARFVDSQINKDEVLTNLTYEQVLFNDLEKSINSIVGILPPQQQKIFQLNRNEGLTNDEIASKLDLSVRTVENQMYRALKTIRTILKEKYF